MLTTKRSDRRTRRDMIITAEYLDERIVLSATSAGIVAEANVMAAVSSSHARSAEKAAVAVGHHHHHSANHAGNLARHAVSHQSTPSSTVTPIVISSSGSVNPAVVSPSATVAGDPPPTTTSTASQTTSASTTAANPAPASTSSTGSSSLPANVSAPLQSLYQQYEAFESSGGSGTFSPTGLNDLEINGTNVGINVYTSDSANFNTLLSQLQSDGLQVTSDSAAYGTIDGTVSIAQLAAIAQVSSNISISPMYRPML